MGSGDSTAGRTGRGHRPFFPSFRSYLCSSVFICGHFLCRGCRMTADVLPLRRVDHVRFFVGNARQSAYFYRNAFGFDVIAYAGLETKSRHEAGYVLRQGDIHFVLASPLGPEHPEAQRIVRHGDGVQDIALEVDDVSRAYAAATARGAQGVTPPTLLEDPYGVYEYATIR